MTRRCARCGCEIEALTWLCDACESEVSERVQRKTRPTMGVSGRSLKSVILPTIAKRVTK